MEKEESNKLIAEFMGCTINNKIVIIPESVRTHNERCMHGYNISQAAYDTSWEWLIPVIDKIESIKEDWQPNNVNCSYSVEIRNQGCIIESSVQVGNPPKSYYFDINQTGDKLLSTYRAIVNFIEWHNKEKK